MFCPECGSPLPEDARYCPYCAIELDSTRKDILSHRVPVTCEACGHTVYLNDKRPFSICPYCGEAELVVERPDPMPSKPATKKNSDKYAFRTIIAILVFLALIYFFL